MIALDELAEGLVALGCASAAAPRYYVNSQADMTLYQKVAVLPFQNLSTQPLAGDRVGPQGGDDQRRPPSAARGFNAERDARKPRRLAAAILPQLRTRRRFHAQLRRLAGRTIVNTIARPAPRLRHRDPHARRRAMPPS